MNKGRKPATNKTYIFIALCGQTKYKQTVVSNQKKNKQMNRITKPLFKSLILIVAISNIGIAQDDSIFPLGEKAPNLHHTGDVWLSHLSAGDSIFDYNVAVAKFEKGAKLDWHKHPKGQHLLIIEGEGLYQERDKPIQVVKKGEIVKCQPDVEHWHAATHESGVTYIAITGNQKTVWFEKIPQKIFENINVDSLKKVIAEEEIIKLSKDKWQWMSDKNVEMLAELFHDRSKFVHMSGTWNKKRELEIIESGSIWYKNTDVHDVVVEVLDDTAVLWNRITLQAHVRGNDVSNEFTVTEIYKKQENKWKLLDLTFSSVRDTHSIEHK